MRFISEQYPQLYVHDLGVRFHDGVAEVTDKKTASALEDLAEEWGIRRADDGDDGDDGGQGGDETPGGLAEASTVDQVLAWVGDDPDRARQAREAETGEGGKKRATLIARLDALTG